MPPLETPRRRLPALGAALPLIIIMITALSVILAAAQNLGLSASQTSTWILALYAIPGFLSLVLSLYYRQPLLFTGNIFMIIFISSLGDQLSYPELIGAAVLAGAFVVLVTVFGVIARLADWIPSAVVLGLLAGAVMPFVEDIFNYLGEAPVLIGGTVVAYLLSRRILGDRLPAVLPALLVGLAITPLTAQFGSAAAGFSLPSPEIMMPVFSVPAIATAAPVLVVFLVLQANLPSMIYMHSQEYQPPERVVNSLSGLGTILGSLLGPTGVSLSLPATSLVAGPKAGSHPLRHRSVYIVATAALVIGLLAGLAAEIPAIIPLPLLLTLAGLSLVDILLNALQKVTQGPLLLGPLFAFAIALSDISLLGFGNYFWALAIGTGVSYLLERDKLKAVRQQAVD